MYVYVQVGCCSLCSQQHPYGSAIEMKQMCINQYAIPGQSQSYLKGQEVNSKIKVSDCFVSLPNTHTRRNL